MLLGGKKKAWMMSGGDSIPEDGLLLTGSGPRV